jgi:hypothetical protein
MFMGATTLALDGQGAATRHWARHATNQTLPTLKTTMSLREAASSYGHAQLQSGRVTTAGAASPWAEQYEGKANNFLLIRCVLLCCWCPQ